VKPFFHKNNHLKHFVERLTSDPTARERERLREQWVKMKNNGFEEQIPKSRAKYISIVT